MSKRTGLIGPFLQPSKYGRNEAGQFAFLPYEDVDADRINRLAFQFDAQGYRYEVTHGFGKHRLEVQLSYNNLATETPVDLWEYNDQSVAKDLLQSATNTGITGLLSQLNIEVIRKALSGTYPDNAPKDAAGVTTLNAACFTDGNPAKALIIYNLMNSGMSDYLISYPTLTHTQTVSQIYPITLSLDNVGNLISTATLINNETAPAWVNNGLPTKAPPIFSDGKQFIFAWYKDGPRINQIANFKWSIVQEFRYGLWPTAVYGNAL